MRNAAFLTLLCTAPLSFAATPKEHARLLHPLHEPSESQFAAALHRIDTKVPEMMEAAHVPGLSMAIVKDGKVVLLKGYGYRNLEKKLPMTPDTVTCIASCSKAFTSTLALMAVQDGKLSLDDPVRKYLPYFRLKDPQADAQMTVADLMCHSSGLPRTDMGWSTEVLSAEDCVRLLGDCEPTFAFRENAQYSNVLVHTASMVTSSVYGRPLQELLKEKITGPLQMDSTSYELAGNVDKSRMSIGYWFNPQSGAIERERYDDAPNIMGAGAIKSTARDLSHWLQFHLGQGTYQGKQILDPAVLALAYKPRQEASDATRFALGWYTDDRWPLPVVEHGGDLEGFQSLVCLIPSRHIGIVFSDNNDAAGLRGPLLSMILENLIGKRDKVWDAQPAKEVGVFVDPSASHLIRTFFDGALNVVLDQGKPIRLTRKGWRTYETTDPREPQLTIVFLDDAKSKKAPTVELKVAGSKTMYHKNVSFDPGTTVAELMSKSLSAYGGKEGNSKPLNLGGRYTSIFRQEGLTSEGLLLRTGQDVGFMDRLYHGKRYLATELTGLNQKWGGATQTNYRMDPLLGSALLDQRLFFSNCLAVDWKSKFKSVDIIARQNFGGDPVYVLRETPVGSETDIIEFVSEKSGLTVRRESGNPPSVAVLQDYRPYEGVMLPRKIAYIDSTLHEQDILVSDYTTEAHYPHWAFFPLGSAKPPQ